MRKSEAGTVLVEALVALAITSSAVMMSLNGFVQGAGRLKLAEQRLLALAEARSIIAELTGSYFLNPSTGRGVTPAGFPWTMTISEEAISATPFLAKPFRISLKVTMQHGSALPIIVETYVIGRASAE
jgi:hypothetical protein